MRLNNTSIIFRISLYPSTVRNLTPKEAAVVSTPRRLLLGAADYQDQGDAVEMDEDEEQEYAA